MSAVAIFLAGFALGAVLAGVFFIEIASRVIPLTLDRGLAEFRNLVLSARPGGEPGNT